MRKFSVAVWLTLLCFVTAAVAAPPERAEKPNGPAAEDVPAFIIGGLRAYKEKGPEEAVHDWIKDSPIEGTKEALSQANSLRQVQDFYGLYRGFEVVGSKEISEHVRIVYLVLDFDKGPLFARFVCYRSSIGWILTSFNFNTKDDAVFPISMQ